MPSPEPESLEPPESIEPPESKGALRRRLLDARARRPGVDAAVEQAAAELLRGLVHGRGDRTVALYVAAAGEPATAQLISALLSDGLRVLLPVVLPDRDLIFREAEQVGRGGPLALVRGRLGIPVPPATAAVVPLAEAGVVVVPALAVDGRGHRLGRGGGSYDRALTRRATGTTVVALVHDGELVEQVPAQAHDVVVDAAVVGGVLHQFADC